MKDNTQERASVDSGSKAKTGECTSTTITTADDRSTHVGDDPWRVSWDGENDVANPMNWSRSKKWIHIIYISLLTFIESLVSSMLAPAVPEIMASFDCTDTSLDSFVVSCYIIGFAIGPLLAAPLSELHGRAMVYHISNVLFLACTIACALSVNIGMFIAFRLLSGLVGVAPLALGGCSIGDVMPQEAMGTAMAMWGLGSLVGPMFAPILGGYLAQYAGWRWIFWVVAISMGFLLLFSPWCIQETYAPVLLERKAQKLRRQTGDNRYRTGEEPQKQSSLTVAVNVLFRPIKLLLTAPLLMLVATYVAVAYGYEYLTFTTLAFVFQDEYHFDTGLSGLTFLGDGVGTVIGVFTVGFLVDKRISWKKGTNQEVRPEDWLWPMLPGGVITAVGLLWYGWSAHAHSFPVIPLVGMGMFGFGIIAVLQSTTMYLVQAFPVHSASALAGSNILRSLCGALLPLGGLGLYQTLGLGWGNSLLAFIALALSPIPLVLFRYGEKLRKQATRQASRQIGINATNADQSHA